MKTFLCLLVSLGFALLATAQTNIFPSSGNVGIGTATPAYTLDVIGTARMTGTLSLGGGAPALWVDCQQLNSSWATAAWLRNTFKITTSGTYYPITTTAYTHQVINANVRNNGYLMGFDGGGWRDDANDAGSLATIYGMRLQYGHYNTVNSSAQTDTVIGLSLEPYYQKGTIGNIYGLMIGGAAGGTVTGNIFGIYQTDSNTKNYFNGNVGIGTNNPTEKLSVKGRIRAQEVVVENNNWSDYVFAKNYKLTSLSEVEQHIQTQGHLPGVPSAQEVAEKGVSLGDMQALLLAKIEELTLHQIAQAKHQQAQDERIAALEAETLT